jgi:hypothetical protein
MRNPLRSEAEAFRFLIVVIVGAVIVIVAASVNTWAGVAAAVLVFAGLGWWLMHEPVPGASESPRKLASGTPPGRRRVLVVAPPGTESVAVPDGAEVLIVVPATASTVEALTGAVDDRRHDAEATAAQLESQLPGARVEVGADDSCARSRGRTARVRADEVLVAGTRRRWRRSGRAGRRACLASVATSSRPRKRRTATA